MSTGASLRQLVAVTGAGGFIGGRLCDMLEMAGFEVRRLTRRTCSLDDPIALAAGLSGCHALVHCAFDVYDHGANLAIADTIGEDCAVARIRLVHVSSAAVYEPLPDGVLTEESPADRPSTAYTDIKRKLEQRLLGWVETHGLDLVILQPTIVYGPRGGAWTDSPVRELLTGTVLLPDAGQGLCNPVYVDDVCRAAIAACTAKLAPGERLLISGPGPVTWQAFLNSYQSMLGLDGHLQIEPPGRSPIEHPAEAAHASLKPRLRRRLLAWLGAAGRTRVNFVLQSLRLKMRGPAVFRASGAKRALYEARCHVSTAKASDLLGYVPLFDLSAGMAATRAYVQETYGRAAKSLRKRKHKEDWGDRALGGAAYTPPDPPKPPEPPVKSMVGVGSQIPDLAG